MRRLLDLGFVPGAHVGVEFRSPGGEPTAYRIRAALIALRAEDSEQIFVVDRRSADDDDEGRVAC